MLCLRRSGPPSGARVGREKGYGGTVRAASPAVDERRDPETPYARKEGHAAEADGQGADPQRGIDQGAREGGWTEDRQTPLKSLSEPAASYHDGGGVARPLHRNSGGLLRHRGWERLRALGCLPEEASSRRMPTIIPTMVMCGTALSCA